MKIKSKIVLFVCAFVLIFSVLSVSSFAYVSELVEGATYRFVDYPVLVDNSGRFLSYDVSAEIVLDIDGIDYDGFFVENGLLSISNADTHYTFSSSDAAWTYFDSEGHSETVTTPIFTLEFISPNIDSRFITWFVSSIWAEGSDSFYSNLYSSISDGVFGAGVSLTPEQVMTLTLISTVLSYAFILLPLLLVIGFVLRCFRL